MVSWSEAKRRLAILKHYKDYGVRKTMDEFNAANTQIQNYKEQFAELLAAVRHGHQLDGKRKPSLFYTLGQAVFIRLIVFC